MLRRARGTLAHAGALLRIVPPGRLPADGAGRGGLLAPLLPHADGHLDGGPHEAELLAQPALDEPAVAGLEEAAGEQDEPWWPCGGLRGEEDARLLAGADRVRVGRDDLAEAGVEPAGRDAGVPGLQRRLDGRHEAVHVAPGPCRDVAPRGPRDLHELLLDLALEVVAPLLIQRVP